ncbi:MAG TPA: acyl-CoA dehydrogenase family protein [Actinomycetota bacterium]|jgi:alkylation response protein AidB-like acyl-CoA dehydrogenase|nr:acyl-CoA dehydrogenase family protein [Actinomycetota bacterium]
MDFRDSPEDAAFRAEVRAWLEANAKLKPPGDLGEIPLFTDGEREDDVSRQQAWQKVLFDAGWGVITWPKEVGGRDATPLQNFIFRQEMTRYDVPSSEIYLVGHGMVGPTIITHGTDEQRRRWIPKMAEGSEIWCQLWSEPNAGSDLASLQARCERDGTGDWVLNGQKVWTTGAQWSRWGLIITRTDPELPKHRGLTVFVVDMHAPGVEVRPLRQITGGADFNEVFFDDVRIPDDQRIGEINDGWRVAMTTLMFERYAVGTGGSGEGMVTPLVKLASSLSRNGGRAIDDAHVRQLVAEAYVKAKLLTLTGYRSLTKIAKQGAPGPEGSVMKLVRTGLLYDVAEIGTEILGLAGALVGSSAPDDGLWSLNFVGSPGAKIGGGTDDIMRNILGERVLGLPKEPQVDRDMPFRELRAVSPRT